MSDIKVPTLPESIADALIVTWHKKEGDPVKRDEVIVEIETDKVVLEVPAADDGVLGKIIEDEGTTVLAHQVIGSIEVGATASAAPEAAATSEPSSSDNASGSAGQTSPAVRKLLVEHGLEAGDVKGTGKNGRISKEDVERHVSGMGASKGAAATAPTAAAPSSASAGATSGASAPVAAPVLALPIGDGERTEKRVPMTRLRARIAERLLLSLIHI